MSNRRRIGMLVLLLAFAGSASPGAPTANDRPARPVPACSIIRWNGRLDSVVLGAQLPGASAEPAESGRPERRAPVRPSRRLGICYTARILAGDGALPDVYGTVPCVGLVYSSEVRTGVRVAAVIGYGRRSVDAYDDPTFVRPRSAKLEVFPFEWGFRFGQLQPKAIELTAGVAVAGIWLRETLPPLWGDPDSGPVRRHGLVPGTRVSLGPDWRLPWHDLVLAGELSLEVMVGVDAYDGWYADPTAFSWRLSLARSLSAGAAAGATGLAPAGSAAACGLRWSRGGPARVVPGVRLADPAGQARAWVRLRQR